MSTSPGTPARKKALALVLVCVLNFIACWIIAVFIGGNALNGKIEAGRYYLSNHGVYTEVSFLVYCYSWTHTVLAILSLPVAAVAGLGWLINPRPKPAENTAAKEAQEKPDK